MKRSLFIFLFQFFTLWAFGQETIHWEKISDVNTSGLSVMTLDNRGQIFYADRTGGIYQCDKNGQVLNHYSPNRKASVTQFHADRTMNLFIFSEDLQEYVILDRFLNPIVNKRFEASQVGLVKAAALGNNNTLWVFDEANLSLKKIDLRRQHVLQEQPLTLILGVSSLQVNEIREYQNSLFLSSDKGLFIFDNQGNFLKSLPFPDHSKLAFHKNDIFFISNGILNQMNISSGRVIEINLPPLKGEFGIQLQGTLVAYYNHSQIQIFENPFFQ